MLGEVGAESSVMSLGVPAAAIAHLKVMGETRDFPRGAANAAKMKGRQASDPESRRIESIGRPEGVRAVAKGREVGWPSAGRTEKPGMEVHSLEGWPGWLSR